MEKENNIFNQFKPSSKPGVPEGYFEQLQQTLNAQIEPVEKPKKQGLRIVLYSAASVAAVLLIFFTFTQQQTNPTVQVASIDEIQTQTLNGYIEENIENFDEDVFVEAGYIAELIQTTPVSVDEQINELDLDDISDYLADDDELYLEDF